MSAWFQADTFSAGIYFPLEMLSAAVLFSWPLSRRIHYWPKLLIATSALMIVCMLVMSPAISAIGTIGRSTIVLTAITCAVLFALTALLVWLLHAVRFREALYCAACAYLMEHLAYCVRLLLALVIPERAIEPGGWAYWLTLIAIYAAVYVFFSRRIIQDGKLSATATGSLALTLVTLAVVLGMSLAATAYQFEIPHAVYASFCCVALLFGQVKQQAQLKAAQELALQRQLWSLQKAQYELSRASIDAINQKCHDLKHQVAALKHVEDPRRRGEVIDSIQDAVMIYDSGVQTGNEILDTLLSEKSLICAQHEIALSCIADGAKLAFMDPVDLYTLLGNALDNAIEAVLELPPAQRLIRLRVQQRSGLVFLRTDNPYEGTLEMRDGLPLTRKPDRESHGIGLKSIRAITEKYHGFMRLDARDGQFTLTLSFPQCEQQTT